MRALAVEHRHVQPRIVRAIAGGPDDRADVAARQIQRKGRRARRSAVAANRSGTSTSASMPLSIAHASSASSSRFILRSAIAHVVAQRPGELQPCRRADPGQAADDAHAQRAQRVEVDSATVGVAGELQRRHAARALEVVDRVVALVEDAGSVHPPLDVRAAIASRHADVLADRQRHAAGPTAGSRSPAARRSPMRRRRARRRRRAAAGCDIAAASAARSPGGTAVASAGTRATLHAPVASTTARQRHSRCCASHACSRLACVAHRRHLDVAMHRCRDDLRIALRETRRSRASSGSRPGRRPRSGSRAAGSASWA